MTTVYQVACEEAGHPDCAFLMRSEDKDEIVEAARQHVRDVHGEELDRDEVRGAIGEVDWQQAG